MGKSHFAKLCMILSIFDLGCISSGINYPGGDIHNGVSVLTDTKELCQKKCQDKPECLFFTWVGNEYEKSSIRKKCFFKKALNVKKPAVGLYSGPKICPGNFILFSIFSLFH